MEEATIIAIVAIATIGFLIVIGIITIHYCRFHKSEKESNELHDIEEGNGAGLQSQNVQPKTEVKVIIQPNLPPIIQNEIVQIIKPQNLNATQTKNVLHVKLIKKYHIETSALPTKLFNRHVVEGEITAEKALDLSKQRGKSFAETYGTNTVFENPTQFHLCSIESEKLSKLRGKRCYNCGNEGHLKSECPKPKEKRSTNAISSSGASSPRKVIVAIKPVRTFCCEYDASLEDYTIKDLGMKVPIFERRERTNKYHFLKCSINYDVMKLHNSEKGCLFETKYPKHIY